jgi:beta-1,2-xylosyltransferase
LATGLNHNKGAGANWRNSHRERLHFLANDRSKAKQQVLSPIGATGEAEITTFPLKELGEYYMDVKLAGGNWQCDMGDGTCQAMEDEIDFAEKDDAEKSNEYKYVFDVSWPALV